MKKLPHWSTKTIDPNQPNTTSKLKDSVHKIELSWEDLGLQSWTSKTRLRSRVPIVGSLVSGWKKTVTHLESYLFGGYNSIYKQQGPLWGLFCLHFSPKLPKHVGRKTTCEASLQAQCFVVVLCFFLCLEARQAARQAVKMYFPT